MYDGPGQDPTESEECSAKQVSSKRPDRGEENSRSVIPSELMDNQAEPSETSTSGSENRVGVGNFNDSV